MLSKVHQLRARIYQDIEFKAEPLHWKITNNNSNKTEEIAAMYLKFNVVSIENVQIRSNLINYTITLLYYTIIILFCCFLSYFK